MTPIEMANQLDYFFRLQRRYWDWTGDIRSCNVVRDAEAQTEQECYVHIYLLTGHGGYMASRRYDCSRSLLLIVVR